MSDPSERIPTQPTDLESPENLGTSGNFPATQFAPIARALSPTEAAFREYGKQLILKSAETALEFHKTMLGISATFGTLVSALLPILMWGDKDAKLPALGGLLFVAPLLLMLLSSVVFAWGYYPRYQAININVVANIESARESVIRSRRRMAAVGLALFSASLISALGLAIYFRVFV